MAQGLKRDRADNSPPSSAPLVVVEDAGEGEGEDAQRGEGKADDEPLRTKEGEG